MAAKADLKPVELERAPASRTRIGWVILNSFPSVWADEVFDKPQDAKAYLEAAWPKGVPDGFKIVRGRSIVSVDPAPQNFVATQYAPEEVEP